MYKENNLPISTMHLTQISFSNFLTFLQVKRTCVFVVMCYHFHYLLVDTFNMARVLPYMKVKFTDSVFSCIILEMLVLLSVPTVWGFDGFRSPQKQPISGRILFSFSDFIINYNGKLLSAESCWCMMASNINLAS